jgi:hypothetical protein
VQQGATPGTGFVNERAAKIAAESHVRSRTQKEKELRSRNQSLFPDWNSKPKCVEIKKRPPGSANISTGGAPGAQRKSPLFILLSGTCMSRF